MVCPFLIRTQSAGLDCRLAMTRELNKNEFFKVRKAYEEATGLYNDHYYKETIYVLKDAFRLLQRDGVQTRMLAKCYALQARAFSALSKKDKAISSYEAALLVLKRIQDTSLLGEQLEQELNELISPSKKPE